MHSAGLISETEFVTPSTMHFQRAARTDKGVSAIKQIVSLSTLNEHNVELFVPKINDLLPKDIRVFGAKKTTIRFDSKNFCDARTYSYLVPTFAFCCLEEGATTESYRLSTEERKRFDDLLKMFVGTHNFHNFTSQKKYTDPSARRFILSFECSEPFMQQHEDKSLEFVVLRVKGQSFMLHQIRKMIGLAIAVMRGLTTSATIERCFGSERLDIPMAPGLGLLLEHVHYEKYNKRFGGDGIHEPLIWDDYNDQIDELKTNTIFPEVVKTEIIENSMANWLETLPLHCFDVREGKNGNREDRDDNGKNEEPSNDDTNVDDDEAEVANDHESTNSIKRLKTA